MPDLERITRRVVYTGGCITTDKKEGVRFHLLTITNNSEVLDHDDEEKVFYKKGFKGKKFYEAGVVYDLDFTPDMTQIFPNTLKYVRMWGNKEQVKEWQIQDKVFRTARNAEADYKRDASHNALNDLALPVRRFYQKLESNKKPAFLAAFLSLVMRSNPID